MKMSCRSERSEGSLPASAGQLRQEFSRLSFQSMPEFCDVALPVPLDMVFTYRVPADVSPVVGGRVLVPFRQQRMTGIVVELHDRKPSVEIKNVLSVLDDAPVLDDQLLRLGRWIADYYLAPLGEVFRTMLPLNAEFKHGVAYRITAEGQTGAASGRHVGIVSPLAPHSGRPSRRIPRAGLSGGTGIGPGSNGSSPRRNSALCYTRLEINLEWNGAKEVAGA